MTSSLLLLLATLLSPVPAQQAGVAERLWNGHELLSLAVAAHGEVRVEAGHLVLADGTRLLLELPAEMPFRSAGLRWDGEIGPLRLGWPAVPSALYVTGPDDDLGQRCSGLLHSYQGEQAALRVELRGPARLHRLALVSISFDSKDGGPIAPTPQPPGASRGYPKPPVEPRAAWGAESPACNPGYCTVTHLAVHHTAGANEYLSPGYAQCAANVKAIQAYHMHTQGWCDIGYHYLICVHGRIWEGRAGGDDVIGAHDAHNCGSMGTAFMGYFHPPYSQVPTPPMLDAMAELGAWKCDQRGIDPLGSSWYAGLGGVMENVYGHRQVGSTACPGDLLQAEIPGLRSAIDGLMSGGGWSLVLDNPSASYTGSWATGTSATDKYGADYRWASTGAAPARAWWNPDLPLAGTYEISLWWPAGANRNPATRIGLILNGKLHTTTVDQRTQGGRWNVLGSVALPAGARTPIGLSNEGSAGTVVVADALRLVLQ